MVVVSAVVVFVGSSAEQAGKIRQDSARYKNVRDQDIKASRTSKQVKFISSQDAQGSRLMARRLRFAHQRVTVTRFLDRARSGGSTFSLSSFEIGMPSRRWAQHRAEGKFRAAHAERMRSTCGAHAEYMRSTCGIWKRPPSFHKVVKPTADRTVAFSA